MAELLTKGSKIMNIELFEFIKGLKSEKKLDSLGEEATKMKFILKALSHLGWDPFNLDEVFPEQDVGGGKVDFSLRHKNDNKVFIEAKKVGEPLEKHQEQLLNYSFKSGVKIAVLTNGLTWWFYLPLSAGDWEQRRFYTIEINDQDAEVIANKFDDFLSQENVISGKANDNAERTHKDIKRNALIRKTMPKAWEKLVSEPDELLVELISETTEKICGLRPEDKAVEKFITAELKPGKVIIKHKPVKRIPPKGKPTKPIGPKQNYTGKSIESFTFQGTKYEVTKWIELLTIICTTMAATHKDDFEIVLSLVGRKRPHFTRKPNEIRQPKQIAGTDIYFEANIGSEAIVRMCIKVISLFGYKPQDLSIDFK